MKTQSILSRLVLPESSRVQISDARLIAESLRYHANLCHWLVTSVAKAGKQAAPMLARSAQFMRDELGDFFAGAQLDRMAMEPALVGAVISELHAGTSSSQRQSNPMPAL
jgi:hypothetical protein